MDMLEHASGIAAESSVGAIADQIIELSAVIVG
jgi:hypothetical protein